MLHRISQHISPAWAVAVTALVIGAGGVATATIPDGSGVIHGCYKTANGQLNVIDPAKGEQCKAPDMALDWNRQGPKGDTGASGPKGDTGASGPKGETGAAGPRGATGDTGAQGPKGDPCLSSDPQCKGPVGPKGDDGATGPKGADGPAGPQGPQGQQGPPGAGSATISDWQSRPPVNLPASGFEHFSIVTPTVVVPANVTTCQVTSSVQTQPPAGAPNNTVYFRNAVSRNGLNAEDGQYGQYLFNDGSGSRQPSMTRTSIVSVVAGQTVGFGVYFGSLGSGLWSNVPYAATTSYLCH